MIERVSNEITIVPSTGVPVEEDAWVLAISPAVSAVLSREKIARALGRWLAIYAGAEPIRMRGDLWVNVERRDDGGFSMRLHEVAGGGAMTVTAVSTTDTQRPVQRPGEAVSRPLPPWVDPRVAKHGGHRSGPKSQYEFPGMMPSRASVQTEMHRHTAYYGCAWCGASFGTPQAVYAHLAKRHDR